MNQTQGTPPFPSRRILGVDFFVGPLELAVERAIGGRSREAEMASPSGRGPGASAERVTELGALGAGEETNLKPETGGLVVAPSAPGLAVDLVRAPAYREALQTADLVLTDSGFMVLLWRFYTGERLPRHSGLKFLQAVLACPELKRPGAVFWVMPSRDDDVRNRAWLVSEGFPVTEEDTYIAPAYPASGELVDTVLVERLSARRPQVVMLAIGGGVQERLGCTLRAQLPYRPGILCLGAAIAFLTGGQVNIPPWADRLVLGWLFRLMSNPRKFWRRYWEALRLAPLLWRQRERLPELERG